MSRAWPEHTRVLVVEDDLPTARIIQTRLELEGLEVLLARNGLEAMDHIRKEDFQLITTDLMMPGMNGFRLVQEVRELPSPKGRIPILLISSNQNEQDMVRCLAAGADDYMIKPLSAQILVERLWRIFERSRREG